MWLVWGFLPLCSFPARSLQNHFARWRPWWGRAEGSYRKATDNRILFGAKGFLSYWVEKGICRHLRSIGYPTCVSSAMCLCGPAKNWLPFHFLATPAVWILIFTQVGKTQTAKEPFLNCFRIPTPIVRRWIKSGCLHRIVFWGCSVC